MTYGGQFESAEQTTRLLTALGIPYLLFVGLAAESETIEFESYVITCLNTRFEAEGEGKSG